ncbi:MAG: mechanosensitive ion channel [Nannocystis sp.]|nr:mechanosensitive ion channel domain-containing protein [Nannocystis sp.]MBA3545710.1 mechanosensitive ion channel [Nannocystis sp.]
MFSGSALVASILPVLYVGGLLVVGFAVSLLLRRIQRIAAFRQLHPWIPVLHIAVWGPILLVLEGRVVPDVDGPRALGRSIGLVILALAALPWLRSVFHGLVFALELRYRIGDDLQVGTVKGRVIAVGVRALTLRAPDGTDACVPYERMATETVLRLNLEAHDAPCELELEVPADVSPARAVELARQASALSRFASPRCAPEVFLGPRNGRVTELVLRIRGYLFDREHEERYRSDVVERLHSAFAAERARATATSAATTATTVASTLPG